MDGSRQDDHVRRFARSDPDFMDAFMTNIFGLTMLSVPGMGLLSWLDSYVSSATLTFVALVFVLAAFAHMFWRLARRRHWDVTVGADGFVERSGLETRFWPHEAIVDRRLVERRDTVRVTTKDRELDIRPDRDRHDNMVAIHELLERYSIREQLGAVDSEFGPAGDDGAQWAERLKRVSGNDRGYRQGARDEPELIRDCLAIIKSERVRVTTRVGAALVLAGLQDESPAKLMARLARSYVNPKLIAILHGIGSGEALPERLDELTKLDHTRGDLARERDRLAQELAQQRKAEREEAEAEALAAAAEEEERARRLRKATPRPERLVR